MTDTKTIEGFVTLHVPCRYSYLRIIRQTVMDVCARAALSEFNTAQLEMAVDEASANIIEHSYGGENDADNDRSHPGLRINFVQHKDKISVEVYDCGRGFDFMGHKEIHPDNYVEDNRCRGLGMYIINRFVDDIEYDQNTESGNCLRLTKRI